MEAVRGLIQGRIILFYEVPADFILRHVAGRRLLLLLSLVRLRGGVAHGLVGSSVGGEALGVGVLQVATVGDGVGGHNCMVVYKV